MALNGKNELKIALAPPTLQTFPRARSGYAAPFVITDMYKISFRRLCLVAVFSGVFLWRCQIAQNNLR